VAELTYYAGAIASVAGANKRHLCLFNASGSGKKVKVYRVAAAGAPTAAVTGLVIPLYTARITAAPTGGSAGSIAKADTTDANVPAQITTTLAATGGATEEAVPFGVGVVSGEETSAANEAVLYQSVLNGAKTMTLAEGQGIVVKQGALASAGAITIVVCFTVV
jgi:hypothetical protein